MSRTDGVRTREERCSRGDICGEWLPTRFIYPLFLLVLLVFPWTKLKLTTPPKGIFHRDPITSESALEHYARAAVIVASIMKVSVLACTSYSLVTALACVSLGRIWSNRCPIAASVSALGCVAVLVLVLPLTHQGANDGFGIRVATTTTCALAGACSALWVGSELHLLRRRAGSVA
jgi:hypothetical protein